MPALPRARACPRESRQVDEKGYRRRPGECAWVGLPLPRKKFGATTTAHQSHVKSVDRNGSCTWCSFGSGSALDCLSQSVLSGWLAALRTPFNDACLLHAARSRLPIPCRSRPQDSSLPISALDCREQDTGRQIKHASKRPLRETECSLTRILPTPPPRAFVPSVSKLPLPLPKLARDESLN
jgi:hypothetical protein